MTEIEKTILENQEIMLAYMLFETGLKVKELGNAQATNIFKEIEKLTLEQKEKIERLLQDENT